MWRADPALTYQITVGTLVAGDAFAGSLTRAAGENMGVYAIEQGTLALSNNYDLTYVGADLTIVQRAIEVTAAGQTEDVLARGPGADVPDHGGHAGGGRRVRREPDPQGR